MSLYSVTAIGEVWNSKGRERDYQPVVMDVTCEMVGKGGMGNDVEVSPFFRGSHLRSRTIISFVRVLLRGIDVDLCVAAYMHHLEPGRMSLLTWSEVGPEAISKGKPGQCEMAPPSYKG
jgi:hypothetical protein